MLSTARPIFEHVPASFADPVGLADQQAQGVVSLIVVCYGAENAASGGGALGPVYDAFVASSGQLLAVARTTPDYRFPVTPAAALTRFFEHRDAGHAASLSLFELADAECARFLETVFYAECLKLHVDGSASAALVARQIARSSCRGGVLEINDFADPERPRVHLLDLADLGGAYDDDTDGEEVLALALAPHLDGITGRVLLYDRAKNRATLLDRTDRAFDLDGIIEQANRLALARRGSASPHGHAEPSAVLAASPADASPDEQAEAVESYLRERADRPRLVEPTHPHATGLSALVAELQGGSPGRPLSPAGPLTSSGLALAVLDEPDEPVAPAEGREDEEASGDGEAYVEPPLSPEAPIAPTIATLPSPPVPGPQSPVHARPSARHPLATELDRLRTDVFELFEDAVGRDRAVAHEAHVLDETGIASPVASADTVRYLRALLCDEPPKRWHFFKRSRARTYEEAAGKLLAFHAANGHLDDPVVHEVTKLWTRLHK